MNKKRVSKKTMKLTDRNGVTREYEIINIEFYKDMIRTATTAEAAQIWLALGEVGGALKRIS